MSTYTDQVQASRAIGYADALEFIDNFGLEYARKWANILCDNYNKKAASGESIAEVFGYADGFLNRIVDYRRMAD